MSFGFDPEHPGGPEDDPSRYPDNTTPPHLAAERSRLIAEGKIQLGAPTGAAVAEAEPEPTFEPGVDGPDVELPPVDTMRFQRGQGNVSDRLQALEDWAESASQALATVWLAYGNQQRASMRATELLDYRCLGEVSDGKGGLAICGHVMKAKRPEARTWEERIICPNPLHRGELTPMEPLMV